MLLVTLVLRATRQAVCTACRGPELLVTVACDDDSDGTPGTSPVHCRLRGPADRAVQTPYSPRALAMISLAIDSGTSLYAWNCIEYVARPWVRERRSVA